MSSNDSCELCRGGVPVSAPFVNVPVSGTSDMTCGALAEKMPRWYAEGTIDPIDCLEQQKAYSWICCDEGLINDGSDSKVSVLEPVGRDNSSTSTTKTRPAPVATIKPVPIIPNVSTPKTLVVEAPSMPIPEEEESIDPEPEFVETPDTLIPEEEESIAPETEFVEAPNTPIPEEEDSNPTQTAPARTIPNAKIPVIDSTTQSLDSSEPPSTWSEPPSMGSLVGFGAIGFVVVAFSGIVLYWLLRKRQRRQDRYLKSPDHESVNNGQQGFFQYEKRKAPITVAASKTHSFSLSESGIDPESQEQVNNSS